MKVVKHSILDDIAIIEIYNPPVNAISGEVRIGLLQTIETLSIEDKVKAITPVPGGVGPMTIACLLKNTLECFKGR